MKKGLGLLFKPATSTLSYIFSRQNKRGKKKGVWEGGVLGVGKREVCVCGGESRFTED